MRAWHARGGSGPWSGGGGGWGFSERAKGQVKTARTTCKRSGVIIYADGSEVEMQVENIRRMQEEEDTEQEYLAQDVSPRTQERVRLAQSSKNPFRESMN